MGDEEYISIRCIQKDNYSTVVRDEVVLFAATLKLANCNCSCHVT